MSPYIFRYECAAKEHKVAVEGVSKGTEKGQQDERKTSEVSTPSIVTTFLVDEVWSLVSKIFVKSHEVKEFMLGILLRVAISSLGCRLLYEVIIME